MPKNHLFKNGPVSCLLLHGFTATPNELIELGRFLAAQNLTVSIPTLPGHGTHSADLLNYTWRDWFNCAVNAYSELAKDFKEVFVCGLSMGGTLALHIAAHHPVKGVISLSAPVSFPGWQTRTVRLLKSGQRFRKKRGGEDVRDLTARTKLGSYRRFPFYAVDQLFSLIEHVRSDLPEIKQPVLIMHSRNDHTISFKNAQIIFDTVSAKEKRIVELSESYHIITVDYDKEAVKDEVLNFIKTYSRTT